MRIVVIISLLVLVTSCAKRNKDKVIHKHAYQSPYHYDKSKENDSSIVVNTIPDTSKVVKLTNVQDSIVSTISGRKNITSYKKPKKKLHLASAGSVGVEGMVFGGYYIASQNIPTFLGTGITAASYLSAIGLLAAIISIAIGYLAFNHFLDNKQKFLGSGFSLFTLYTTTLAYLTLGILTNVFFTSLAASVAVLIGLAALAAIGYTYFFVRFIKTLRENKK